MGTLRTKEEECQYKEYEKLLTEQFNNGLNDNGMAYVILKVTTLEDTKDATNECGLP